MAAMEEENKNIAATAAWRLSYAPYADRASKHLAAQILMDTGYTKDAAEFSEAEFSNSDAEDHRMAIIAAEANFKLGNSSKTRALVEHVIDENGSVVKALKLHQKLEG